MAHTISNFWLRGEKEIVVDTVEAGLIAVSVSDLLSFMGGHNGDIIDFLNDAETEEAATIAIGQFIDANYTVNL